MQVFEMKDWPAVNEENESQTKPAEEQKLNELTKHYKHLPRRLHL
jgi:hypothetical protein